MDKKIEIFQHYNHKFLFIDGQLWMWDLPLEQEIQQDLARQTFGDVLVAGYGFGIVSKCILENPKVKSVIISDFLKLSEDKKYDCVVADTWQEIDARFLDEYIRNKDKAFKLLKPNGQFLGWGKDFFEYLLDKQKSTTI